MQLTLHATCRYNRGCAHGVSNSETDETRMAFTVNDCINQGGFASAGSYRELDYPPHGQNISLTSAHSNQSSRRGLTLEAVMGCPYSSNHLMIMFHLAPL
jgi:hypothetical protein